MVYDTLTWRDLLLVSFSTTWEKKGWLNCWEAGVKNLLLSSCAGILQPDSVLQNKHSSISHSRSQHKGNILWSWLEAHCYPSVDSQIIHWNFNDLVSKILLIISDVTGVTAELRDVCKRARQKYGVYQQNASIVHFPLLIHADLAA